MRKLFIHTTILLVLSGCDYFNPPPPPAPKLDISFTKYQPIYLDVATIDIVEEYKSPMQEPNVEHLVPISPADAVHLWVKDRLRATGFDNRLQVIIKDASIVSSPLPVPQGVKGMLANPVRQYDAKLAVEMRIYSDKPMSDANIDVSATQSATLPEKADTLQRKIFFNKLVRDLMESANSEIERQMFRYFNGHISYAQTP